MELLYSCLQLGNSSCDAAAGIARKCVTILVNCHKATRIEGQGWNDILTLTPDVNRVIYGRFGGYFAPLRLVKSAIKASDKVIDVM